ncbi:hypothetical protein INS49_012715 [Diaporthe citri]|uniref:uncharacterized protein n=1 Tax=Diaporthe citri TaxID=83186 RepID=UPI001C7E289E|nr:uncharacterized protein INS49_012715 [Diaporthe citri]KAG6359195.1 hypothetical protein INS49_012715 [Diaporthe citri]
MPLRNKPYDLWANTLNYHGVLTAGAAISESIKRFTNNGQVGASGQMGCESSFETPSDFWKLQYIKG